MRDIAILMSTYNGEKYLEEQLTSILNQTLINRIDIWIRDDGSTNDTVTLLQKFKSSYNNIFVIFDENVGCTQSFFTLIEKVEKYDYYAFSDQDDVWLPNKIERAISMLSNVKGPALYGGCSSLVDRDLNTVGKTQICRRKITFYNALIQNLMPGHTQVFNEEFKSLIKNDLDMSKIIVHDYWLALMATAFATVIFDNEPFTLYRQHSNNEIGYGFGHLGWITERLRRVMNQAARDITIQDQYFLSLYSQILKHEYKSECIALISSQSHLFTRIYYLITKRVYRQKKTETLLFSILYLFGGYKI